MADKGYAANSFRELVWDLVGVALAARDHMRVPIGDPEAADVVVGQSILDDMQVLLSAPADRGDGLRSRRQGRPAAARLAARLPHHPSLKKAVWKVLSLCKGLKS